MHNFYNSAIITDSQNQKVNDIISDLKKLNLFKSINDVETFTSGGGYVHTLILCKNGHIVAIHFGDGILEYSASSYVSIDSYLSEEMADRDRGFGYEYMEENYDDRNIDLESDTLRFLTKVSSMKMAKGGTVKTDKYGYHIEPQFKVGDQIIYAGYPGEITKVHKGMYGRYYYDVSYNVGQGQLNGGANYLANKANEIKFRNDKMAGGGVDDKMTFKEFSETLRDNDKINSYTGKTTTGMEMYYLPTGHPHLGKKFAHKNKRKAYEEYLSSMSKSTMATGGGVDGMSTVNEIARLSGLRPIAIAEWGDKNNINLATILRDLKAKKIKGMDLMTAIVGKPGNKYSKEFISKYSKMANGGVIGQEIVFDDSGEENTGVIKDIHETTGDYIVLTDDGRTVLAQKEMDVISLGKMRKASEKPKRFGFFENGGGVGQNNTESNSVNYHFERAKKEILEDIEDGNVPNDVDSFNELHEYVDANGYGGFFDDDYEISKDFVVENEVHKKLDKWIKSGGLKSKMEKGGELSPMQKQKFAKVMHEWKKGKLHSGSKNGPVVTDQDQAVAIAYAEARGMKKMDQGGDLKDTKFADRVYTFLVENGYDLSSVDYFQDGTVVVYPSSRKVGSNRKDFFDGMQIIKLPNGYYEVSEYLAGPNQDQTYVYKNTKSLNVALKDLIRGNKRKPVEKYELGGDLKLREDEYAKGGGVGLSHYDVLGGSTPFSDSEMKTKIVEPNLGSNFETIKMFESGKYNPKYRELENKFPNEITSNWEKIYRSNNYQGYAKISPDRKVIEAAILDNFAIIGVFYVKSSGQKRKMSDGGGVDDGAKSQVRIRDWYMKNYPTDDLGPDLNRISTFEDLWNGIHLPMEIYVVIGVGDSLIRERLFSELSEIKNVDYDYIYNKWTEDPNYAKGGTVENNNEMFNSQIKEAEHHIDEISQVVSKKTDIEPWVLSKMTRAKTDLSDLTHYLDGKKQKFAVGGGVDKNPKVENFNKFSPEYKSKTHEEKQAFEKSLLDKAGIEEGDIVYFEDNGKKRYGKVYFYDYPERGDWAAAYYVSLFEASDGNPNPRWVDISGFRLYKKAHRFNIQGKGFQKLNKLTTADLPKQVDFKFLVDHETIIDSSNKKAGKRTNYGQPDLILDGIYGVFDSNRFDWDFYSRYRQQDYKNDYAKRYLDLYRKYIYNPFVAENIDKVIQDYFDVSIKEVKSKDRANIIVLTFKDSTPAKQFTIDWFKNADYIPEDLKNEVLAFNKVKGYQTEEQRKGYQ